MISKTISDPTKIQFSYKPSHNRSSSSFMRGSVNAAVLVRLGSALIGLFAVNALFGLLPLQLFNPTWQLRIADLLRTTAPFTLLGVGLIYLGEGFLEVSSQPLLSLKRIQKLVSLAAIGFLLLIPLQANATWMQIRTADVEAQRTIRSVERRIAAVQAVSSAFELKQLSQGLPPDWQPLPETSLADNRAALLNRVQPELAQIRTTVSQRKGQAIQKGLQDLLRDSLISLIYAWAFLGLRVNSVLPIPIDQTGLGEIGSGDQSMAGEVDNSWF